MDPRLTKLNDIQTIDLAPSWPPGIGWYLLGGLALILLSASIYWFIKRYRYRKSWRFQMYQNIDALEKLLGTPNHKPEYILHESSKLLRITNIKIYGRKKCASLTGKQWISWLQDHDPKHYNWEQHESILIDVAYKPKATINIQQHLPAILKAMKQWVS